MTDVQDVAAMLTRRRLTVAVAEAATGGVLSALLSSPPGASAYYRGSVVAYANDVKTGVLGVPEDAFADGAVSEAVAVAMARGVRRALHADIGVADTGIAGPGGATETKPVGLYYIALAGVGGHEAVRAHRFAGGRDATRRAAADAALVMLAAYAASLP